MKKKIFTLTNINDNVHLDGQYQFDLLPRLCVAWNIYGHEKYRVIILGFINYELEIRL